MRTRSRDVKYCDGICISSAVATEDWNNARGMGEATADGQNVEVYFAGDRTGKKVVLEMKWLVDGVDVFGHISFFKFLKIKEPVRIMRFDVVDVHIIFLCAFDQKAPKVLLLNLETNRTSVLYLAEFSNKKVPQILKARRKRIVQAGPLLNACIAHIKAACIAWKTEDVARAVQFSVARAAAPVTAPLTDGNIAKKAAAGSVKVLGFYVLVCVV